MYKVLMKRNFDVYVYLGTCFWKEHGYGSVTFRKVNRASGYQLENSEQLELFSHTIVAVVKLIQQDLSLATVGPCITHHDL